MIGKDDRERGGTCHEARFQNARQSFDGGFDLLAGVAGVAVPARHAEPQTRAFRQAFPAARGRSGSPTWPAVSSWCAARATRWSWTRPSTPRRRRRRDPEAAPGHEVGQGRDRKGRRGVGALLSRWTTTAPSPIPAQGRRSELPWFLSCLESAGHTSTTYRGERVRIYHARRARSPTLYAEPEDRAAGRLQRGGAQRGRRGARRRARGDARGGHRQRPRRDRLPRRPAHCGHGLGRRDRGLGHGRDHDRHGLGRRGRQACGQRHGGHGLGRRDGGEGLRRPASPSTPARAT